MAQRSSRDAEPRRSDSPTISSRRSARERAAPHVSVLMPCRDAARYLPDTITSLIAQTFPDFEVIAVDDGSTDDTLDVLHRWADRDARVVVAAQPPLGIVTALQHASRVARGDILLRMDADDVAAPERIAKQVALLSGAPHVDACGTLVRYFPREMVMGGAARYEAWINSLVDHDRIVRDIFVECPIAHPTLALRRTAFDAAGGYLDTGWPEDYDLVLRLWQRGARFGKVPEHLLQWRERPDRASRSDPRYSAASFRRCKVHHLRHTLLAGDRGVVIWGAGPVGKTFARELQRHHVPVHAFVDLDPRKIGQTVHGAPVVATDAADGFPGALHLAAVGQPDARDRIRAMAGALGLREGADIVAVA
jgi:GT2 family glycosyltransferase